MMKLHRERRIEVILALLRGEKTKQQDKWTVGGRARVGKDAKRATITLAKVSEDKHGRR